MFHVFVTFSKCAATLTTLAPLQRRGARWKQARQLFEVLRELDAFEETKEGTIWVKAIADLQPKSKDNSANKSEKPVSGNTAKATSGKR